LLVFNSRYLVENGLGQKLDEGPLISGSKAYQPVIKFEISSQPKYPTLRGPASPLRYITGESYISAVVRPWASTSATFSIIGCSGQ
jgi:hypothetical protein